MKLVPLGDRVVLKQLVAEETTKSGRGRHRKNRSRQKLWQLDRAVSLTVRKSKWK